MHMLVNGERSRAAQMKMVRQQIGRHDNKCHLPSRQQTVLEHGDEDWLTRTWRWYVNVIKVRKHHIYDMFNSFHMTYV